MSSSWSPVMDDNSSAESAAGSNSSAEECVVCANSAHGVHFGVMSCRACAAFYRRTIVLGKGYKCRKAIGAAKGTAHALVGTCIISKEERYLCRFCRFRKCEAVGMKEDNVQWNRDKTTSQKAPPGVSLDPAAASSPPGILTAALPGCSAFTRYMPEKKLDPVTPADRARFFLSADSPREKTLIDTSGITINITRIFAAAPDLSHVTSRRPLLDRLLLGLQHIRRNQDRSPRYIERVVFARSQKYWEKSLYTVAEFGMHLDEFVQLPEADKLTLYKMAWGSVHRLERIYTTIDIFGRQQLLDEIAKGRMLFVTTDHHYIDYKKTEFDMSLLTDLNSDAIKRMLMPSVEQLYEVGITLIEERVCDIEMVYLMAQLLWHVEGWPVSDATHAVADSLRERLSAELHDYYVTEMRLPSYAARHVRLLGLLDDIENVQHERSRMIELARIFDLFKFDLNDTHAIPVD